MNTKAANLNLHIYPSYLTNESRILRETQSLIKQGLVNKIIVVGYWREGLYYQEEVSRNVTFLRLKTAIKKQQGSWKIVNLLSFPLFYMKIIFLCFKSKPDIVNCHTLTTLPVGFLIKFLLGTKLIYDPHELETETNESKGIRKIIAKTSERIFIWSAQSVIVVSHHIADWYKTEYGLNNVSVIKNIPAKKILQSNSTILRQSLRLTQNDICFLYVGTFEKGRGINLLLDAFKEVDKNKHLIFLGYGSLQHHIQSAADEHSNIHCLEAVSPEQVLDYVSGADVGLCLIENSCLSYYYCLPNKAFEYLGSGIPFISSGFPELKREFESSNVCWFVDLNHNEVKKLINQINFEKIDEKKEKVIRSRDNWTWSAEEAKYIEIYQSI